MKKCFLLLLIAAGPLFSFAQSANTVAEDKPFVTEGVEYGYSIRNVSTREVSNKDFSRYEVSLYATNKSECSRIILFSQSLGRDEGDMNKLVQFDCLNATGARLTSKTGSVTAKPMYVTARVSTRDNAGKNITESQKVQIGYYLGVGETVTENVIFIVPLNEKPDLRVRIVNRATTL
ncbi:ABC transporter permease [Segetibacter sp. 3557_3]|uniref:ABC transporter permease n=1 Tax=Segetibacter sp. 3557_3 TaxID=2547429 RepID=UPI00105911D9|nr:ABC transporter permease [Segetibacter sp. 3557_3]TDH25219.1 ABC transporter permease [Segetibacter sp. 3557_3]